MLECTLKQMAVFEAVMVTGTVGGAAEKLGITQPAASLALAEWERRTGGSCFDRLGKRLVPNTRGKNLVLKARKVLESAKELEGEIAGRVSKVIRLAASPVIIDLLISQGFSLKIKDNPSIQWQPLQNSIVSPQDLARFDLIFNHEAHIGPDFDSEYFHDLYYLPVVPYDSQRLVQDTNSWMILEEQRSFEYFSDKKVEIINLPYDTLCRLISAQGGQALIPESIVRGFVESKKLRILAGVRVSISIYQHRRRADT